MKIKNLIYAILLITCLSTSSKAAKKSMADKIAKVKQPSNLVSIEPDSSKDKPQDNNKAEKQTPIDKLQKTEAPQTSVPEKNIFDKEEPKEILNKEGVENKDWPKNVPKPVKLNELEDKAPKLLHETPKPENVDKQEDDAKEEEKKDNATEQEIITPQEEWKNNTLQLNFENASLKNVLDDISDIFDLVFIPDEAIHTDSGSSKTNSGPSFGPQPPASKNKLTDTKITFRTQDALTKDRTLAILDIFLEISSLARVPILGMPENYFRITDVKNANKTYLPTYIGTDPSELPDTGVIRYLYFLTSANVNSVINTIKELKSPAAEISSFQDSNALIITDQAYNIKSLMKIIKEVDEHGFPEILTIIKLQNADATEAVSLFKSLQGGQSNNNNSGFGAGTYRPAGSSSDNKEDAYFSSGTKIIADTRTNSLIILGKKEAVQRAENFISEYIDKSLSTPPDLLHVEELNWVTAQQMAAILNTIVQYGKTPGGGQGKGQGGQKFFSNLAFEAEPQGNRLIIKGKKEDYELIRPVIRDLDQKQPQVAIEVIIATVAIDKNKSVATRMRTPTETPKQFNFQTSPGFNQAPIQINQTNNSIVANLINLATSAVSGSTLLTLGKTSVWAIMSILKTTTNTTIVSNPFIVATNKYPSSVSLGSTRRITTGTISGISTGTTQGDADANLTVTITPQINSANNINLSININIEDFTSDNTTVGNKSTKRVVTNANVADGEVIALGGIIRNKSTTLYTGVPILSKLPLVGSLFKYRSHETLKENLVIFMAPKIIRTEEQSDKYTQIKSEIIKDPIYTQINEASYDPIQRYFFGDTEDETSKMLETIKYDSSSQGVEK